MVPKIFENSSVEKSLVNLGKKAETVIPKLNKCEILADVAKKEGLIADDVIRQFDELAAHTDEVTIERLLKLTQEGKVRMASPKGKSMIFLTNRTCNDGILVTESRGILNYMEGANEETNLLLKRLVAAEKDGKLDSSNIAEILKINAVGKKAHDSGFISECNELLEMIRTGKIKNEEIKFAQAFIENGIPLNLIHTKDFKNLDIDELKLVCDTLRGSRGVNFSNTEMYTKVLKQLQAGVRVNKVSLDISRKFVNNLDKMSKVLSKSEYSIENIEETKEYLENETLKSRLIEISQALLDLENTDAKSVMGPDHVKLKSSMTLFKIVEETYNIDCGKVFEKVLDKYFNGEIDNRTVTILEKQKFEKQKEMMKKKKSEIINEEENKNKNEKKEEINEKNNKDNKEIVINNKVETNDNNKINEEPKNENVNEIKEDKHNEDKKEEIKTEDNIIKEEIIINNERKEEEKEKEEQVKINEKEKDKKTEEEIKTNNEENNKEEQIKTEEEIKINNKDKEDNKIIEKEIKTNNEEKEKEIESQIKIEEKMDNNNESKKDNEIQIKNEEEIKINIVVKEQIEENIINNNKEENIKEIINVNNNIEQNKENNNNNNNEVDDIIDNILTKEEEVEKDENEKKEINENETEENKNGKEKKDEIEETNEENDLSKNNEKPNEDNINNIENDNDEMIIQEEKDEEIIENNIDNMHNNNKFETFEIKEENIKKKDSFEIAEEKNDDDGMMIIEESKVLVDNNDNDNNNINNKYTNNKDSMNEINNNSGKDNININNDNILGKKKSIHFSLPSRSQMKSMDSNNIQKSDVEMIIDNKKINDKDFVMIFPYDETKEKKCCPDCNIF